MPIVVTADALGTPQAFVLAGRRERVAHILERWLIDVGWWGRGVLRRYFSLVTPSGILGAELKLADGHQLTLLVADQNGWRNLCTLISHAQANAPKGHAALAWADLERHTDGLIALSGCRHGPVAAALRRWDRTGAFRA